MTCRFLKSTTSKWPRLSSWKGLCTVLMGLGTLGLHAQVASPAANSPKPGSTPKPQAYVRFWNMLIGPPSPALQLATADDKPLTSSPPGNAFARYLNVDPGSYTFIVRPVDNPNAVIKRLPVILRADVYITLLATVGKDGRADVQLIDDTVNPKTDDGLGTLVVRQFFPGASVTLGLGAAPTGTPLTFGESTTLTGLPLRAVVVNMRATGLGPTPKSWNFDADFVAGNRHATILVVPDPYKRFRPQLVYDGASQKPPPDPASVVSGTSTRKP